MRRGPVLLTCAALLAGCAQVPESSQLPLPAVLLWGAPFPELFLDISYVEGREPSALAIEQVLAVLREQTDKSLVEIREYGAVKDYHGDPDRIWTSDTLHAFYSANFGEERRRHDGISTPALHILYLDGSYSNGEDEAAYGMNSGIDTYVFVDKIRNTGNFEPPQADRVERSVLVHEIGHALGLVGCGVPMVRPHQSQDGCHSSNEASVMYASADVAVLDALWDTVDEGSAISYEFDEDDLRDLAAYREQGRQWAARQSTTT